MDICGMCNRHAVFNGDPRILSSLEHGPRSHLTDPCQPHPCFKDTDCVSDPQAPRGFHCGLCPEGYKGDGFNCKAESCEDEPCYRGGF